MVEGDTILNTEKTINMSTTNKKANQGPEHSNMKETGKNPSKDLAKNSNMDESFSNEDDNVLIHQGIFNKITLKTEKINNKTIRKIIRDDGESTNNYLDRGRERVLMESLQKVDVIPKMHSFWKGGYAMEYVDHTPLGRPILNDTTNNKLNPLNNQTAKLIAQKMKKMHEVSKKGIRNNRSNTENTDMGLSDLYNNVNMKSLCDYDHLKEIRALHSTMPWKKYSFHETLGLESFEIRDKIDQAIKIVEALLEKSEYKEMKSICHNDLHEGNILYYEADDEDKNTGMKKDGVYFIDFEFAFVGYTLADLARYFTLMTPNDSFYVIYDRVNDKELSKYQSNWLMAYYEEDIKNKKIDKKDIRKIHNELPIYALLNDLLWAMHSLHFMEWFGNLSIQYYKTHAINYNLKLNHILKSINDTSSQEDYESISNRMDKVNITKRKSTNEREGFGKFINNNTKLNNLLNLIDEKENTDACYLPLPKNE
eukprot:GHVP01000357.1.p1 GENE.GHVP01000357.1~~GHVP01000357.1.p1  ORF type:complete len:481 (-),score=72.59 GHVP01000357.1:111-1553(-)